MISAFRFSAVLKLGVLGLLALGLSGLDTAGAATPEPAPLPQRKTSTLVGWTLHVDTRLPAAQVAAALPLLKLQLEEIERVVPPVALAELRLVPLWFTAEYPGVQPRAEYHPGAGWLREHGRDPSMERGVEFTNLRIFAEECRRMPNFALHELAHAYHHRVLGHNQADIQAAYSAAVAAGRYDRVQRQNAAGRLSVARAYALTNQQEYFAEGTESFFSRNDFQPFNREELRQLDPALHDLLARLWRVQSYQPTEHSKAAKPPKAP